MLLYMYQPFECKYACARAHTHTHTHTHTHELLDNRSSVAVWDGTKVHVIPNEVLLLPLVPLSSL